MDKQDDNSLEQLWLEFGNVPMSEDEEIEEDFHIWKAGTGKYDIWQWFDNKHSKGVYYLVYEMEGDIK